MKSKPVRGSPIAAKHGKRSDTIATPEDHYHHEKARRASKDKPNSDLMAAAKREYAALLAASAVKGKGGRPKKKPDARPADIELENAVDEPTDE